MYVNWEIQPFSFNRIKDYRQFKVLPLFEINALIGFRNDISKHSKIQCLDLIGNWPKIRESFPVHIYMNWKTDSP